MCGITGILNFSDVPVEPGILSQTVTALRHRGSDDEGVRVDGPVALGQRRLAVIDLTENGRQPMPNEDETIWIIFNGEIYNFMDLRDDALNRGHRFRSKTDCETILHLYEDEGTECLQRLRGMFAFVLWDSRRRTLFLARDRLGKKPLYYYHDNHCFIFASEIKAILSHPDVPRRVNRFVVPLYLAYGYVPEPYTMFEGIYELPPGHALTVRDGQVKIRGYWNVPYSTDRAEEPLEYEIVEQLRMLLEDAVRVRLISDVPLGAFLSGGIDSTAVVAYMAKLMDQPVKTFAIGFEDDPSFNELEYARLAARAYGTDHHEFIVRPDAVELLPTLVWHYDQPFADSSALSTYLVSKLSREHVTVALTGDGGDELFAGYDRFAAARLAERYCRTPRFVQGALESLLRRLPESTRYNGFVRRARQFVENAPRPLAHRYLGWAGIFSDGFIREMMASEPLVDPLAHFQTYFEPVQHVDLIGQLLYVNSRTYLPGDLLVKTDRMTMAHSLEARSPLLDQKLLEFAASIPSNLKLKGLTTKHIMKKALEGFVPPEIIRRRKHGFGVPVGHWFRGSLKDYVREMLLSPEAVQRHYFKEEAVRRFLDEHQSRKRDHGHRLWALLTFEVWHRIFIDQKGPIGVSSHG